VADVPSGLSLTPTPRKNKENTFKITENNDCLVVPSCSFVISFIMWSIQRRMTEELDGVVTYW
jgi:hypothetical protein